MRYGIRAPRIATGLPDAAPCDFLQQGVGPQSRTSSGSASGRITTAVQLVEPWALPDLSSILSGAIMVRSRHSAGPTYAGFNIAGLPPWGRSAERSQRVNHVHAVPGGGRLPPTRRQRTGLFASFAEPITPQAEEDAARGGGAVSHPRLARPPCRVLLPPRHGALGQKTRPPVCSSPSPERLTTHLQRVLLGRRDRAPSFSPATIAGPRGQSQARTGSRDGSESGPRPEIMITKRPQPETDKESFTTRSIDTGTRGHTQPSQDSPGERSSQPALPQPKTKLPTSAIPLATETEAPMPSRSPAAPQSNINQSGAHAPPQLPIFARVNRPASSPTA